MDSDRLDGVILRTHRVKQEEFKTSVYEPSTLRLLALSAIPTLAAGGVGVYTAFACTFANPGDALVRNAIKVGGGVVVALLLLAAALIFLVNRQQRWTLEADRLSYLDPGGLISQAWDQVELAEESHRLGVGQVNVVMAGRTCVLSSVFFPEFERMLGQMKERVEIFDRALSTL